MTPVQLVLAGLAVMAVYMAVLWLVQVWRKDASHVDVGWAAGLGILALGYAPFVEGGSALRTWLVAGLAAAWSARLALYLFVNRIWGREEDGRYVAMRNYWGPRANLWFFPFFQFQAVADALFSIPFLVAMLNPRPTLGPADALAVLVWIVAVGGESIADRQLAAWRNNPANRGRTCRAGLWRWSRHPNYFFEWLHWFAYVLFAVGSSWWWLTLIGPALMLFLLYRVTGIPYTELQALKSRGDDYRAYQRTTSAFFPWFPKNEPDAAARPAEESR